MCPRSRVRAAALHEAPLLTQIALRAKAYWGYGAAFMRAVQDEMVITPARLAEDTTFVLEVDGSAFGFYKLHRISAREVELTDLFLDPVAIGQGWGRVLWEHAVATARDRGFRQMTWESDPNAEGFYLHMGAQRVGAVASNVEPGRFLPRMRLLLPAAEDAA